MTYQRFHFFHYTTHFWLANPYAWLELRENRMLILAQSLKTNEGFPNGYIIHLEIPDDVWSQTDRVK